MSKKGLVLLMGLALLFVIFNFALAQETPQSEQPQPTQASSDEPQYTNDSIARVSYLQGKGFIQRAADIGYEDAVLNDPVAEGDRIGTADGRLEIQFGQRNYLRLDNDSKVDVLNLPKKDSELTRFRLWSGHIYLLINQLNKEKNIEIHTPDSSFYILERGIYRIDVEENKGTEILVFKGLAEAAGEQDSYLVKAEQRLDMAQGRFNSKPVSFRPVADDSFDRWNESRDKEVNKYYASRYLPEDLSNFEAELDQYGHWVYIAPYGYVWVPDNLSEDWRPYYYGRWAWIPLTGWTWVPYEPWGWVAFHYGRWQWAIGVGWYWIPTSIWGPAWVSWWWDADYFAWAPLSWYGYPGVIINNVFYDHYVGHYPLNSRTLVVVRRDQLRATDISRTALRPEVLKAANLENKISLTSRQLPFRPEGSRLTVEKLDSKRVLVRQNNQGVGLREIKANPAGTSVNSIRRPTATTESQPKEAPKSFKPAESSKGKSTASPKVAPSGKVTPKKIRKKEESPYSSSPQYRTTNISRTIPVYPSSPKITVRNLNRPSDNYYRPYSSGVVRYSNPSNSSTYRSSSPKYYNSSPRISTPKVTPRVSRPSISSSPKSYSVPHYSSSSGSIHRKK
ncbi:MAG: DUF6600 domain-containing protein [Candidatus Saccharicenans sp.]|nr:MAG: hypothetical protein C0168_08830 [Candidatus Aminicenantes bacterium]HEK86047.1 hypothetical protein [Candidatus Aminicenantes bacterium]